MLGLQTWKGPYEEHILLFHYMHIIYIYILSSRPKLHEDHAHAPFYLFLWMGMSPRSVELHSPNWFRHDLLNFTSSIKHRDQNRTTRFYPQLTSGGGVGEKKLDEGR